MYVLRSMQVNAREIMGRRVAQDAATYRQDLPSQTYVPGWTERPRHPSAVNCGDPLQRGAELFDAGYYWEAHEAWEQVWISWGRTGARADRLKGLIKLAAAGVKALEQNSQGVGRHADRAVQLLSAGGSWPEELNWLSREGVLQLAMDVAAARLVATPLQRDQAASGGAPLWPALARTNVSAPGPQF